MSARVTPEDRAAALFTTEPFPTAAAHHYGEVPTRLRLLGATCAVYTTLAGARAAIPELARPIAAAIRDAEEAMRARCRAACEEVDRAYDESRHATHDADKRLERTAMSWGATKCLDAIDALDP